MLVSVPRVPGGGGSPANPSLPCGDPSPNLQQAWAGDRGNQATARTNFRAPSLPQVVGLGSYGRWPLSPKGKSLIHVTGTL